MSGGWLAQRWRRDRLALAITGLASAVATVGWRATTRPMADTSGYRAAAEVLRHGWPTLTDRTPGYPLLLLLTGSAGPGPHRLLFVVQLLMHAATIVLVVDLAGRVGVGRIGRAALAALLVSPAVLLRVVYEGTEGLCALLLTLIAWLLLTPWDPRHRLRRAIVLGACSGYAAMVRPTFTLLFVPVALLALGPARRAAPAPGTAPADHRGAGAAVLAAVALPALVFVGGLSASNAIRFDSPGLTPLAPYHLSSRTSPYVERLPRSYEPARSVLIEARDRALLRGESMAPENFIWDARADLAEATGLRGPALDRYVMRIDLELILHHPFDYLDTVKTSSVNYSNMDSQPAVQGLGVPLTWAQQAAHLVLLAAALGLWALVPGLGLVGLVDPARARTLVVALGLSAYTGVVSVMTETGTARLRAPTEPLLALALVVAAAIARPALAGWLTRTRQVRDAGRNT